MADTIFDAVVVGGGPAGYTCAIRAAQYGLKVALVDANDRLGGTCLLWGCIPTKAILFTAEVWDHLKHAQSYGIDVAEPKLNWKNVIARKDDVITRHTKGLDFLMKKNKITVFKGYGKLTGPAKDGVHTVAVKLTAAGRRDGEGEECRSRHRFRRANAAGVEGGRHHPDQLRNPEVAGDAEVAGDDRLGRGGRGVCVHLQELRRRGDHPGNAAARGPCGRRGNLERTAALFKKRGIDVNLSIKDTKIEKNKDGVLVSWTDSNGKPQQKQAEKVLVAVGRSPRTADIGLEKTNIKPDRGFILTNEWMETPSPASTPSATSSAACRCWRTPARWPAWWWRRAWPASTPAGQPQRIPGCTYTEPQVASVGLTEAAAKEKGFQVKVGKFPFVGNSKATILDAHDGFVKVVADAKYGEILGVHIIGPYATEIIAEAVTALELEATVEEMMFTIHAHPTVAEALLDGYSSVEGKAVNV